MIERDIWLQPNKYPEFRSMAQVNENNNRSKKVFEILSKCNHHLSPCTPVVG